MKEQFAKNLLILDSREAILALAPLLETLAARCGQPAAMHWMPYFLDKAVLGRRLPRLVLLLNPEEQNEKSLQVEHLHAAALFFEYQLFGLRTGVVATGDAVGFNSIIAPAGERSRVAALASRALLDRGASICVATFDEEGNAGQARKSLGASRLRWAVRNRRVARMLPLKPTLDETLARMGKSTRFNLRYYRRRLEKQMRCDFYAEAGPLLREADLDGMNAASLNPVESGEFRRRITAASSLPGSFLCGLQGPDGKWLSLIGGWRQEQTTVLYWQMNASGLEKHSIGTVMRSYFLENEIARGSRKLLIFGGTPHSMNHSFHEDEVADLVVERPSLRSSLLRQAVRMLRISGRLGPNFVCDILRSPELAWQTGSKPSAAAPRAVLKTVGPPRAVSALQARSL